jgi:biopolymer transport protein ExbB
LRHRSHARPWRLDPRCSCFSQGDAVTKAGGHLLLLAMSVASWVVILWKAWLLRAPAAMWPRTAAFWQAPTLGEARTRVAAPSTASAAGAAPDRGHQLPAGGTLAAAGRPRAAAHPGAARRAAPRAGKLQFGQVLLATVGSTAPFVGLLGTVWGIYHALIGIASAGQITSTRWPARWARR